MKYFGIDIGGTWIKGTIVNENFFDNNGSLSLEHFPIKRIKSPLHVNATIDDLVKVLKELIAFYQVEPEEIGGIGISTAGIINYAGTKVLKASTHLNVLKTNVWQEEFKKHFKCSSVIINDADAATIGLAEIGYLKGNKTIGIMPVGTGMGFSVWKNGRRWRPGKNFTLLGSIRSPKGDYNSIVSASRLASLDKNDRLDNILTNNRFKKERELYIHNLVDIINTAAILYNLDDVIIGGGLANAVNENNYPLEQILNDLLLETPVELEKSINAIIPREGNQLQLIGALSLAKGESIAIKNRIVYDYKKLNTEKPYKKEIQLQNLQTLDIIEILWQAEQETGDMLKSSLSIISDIVNESVKRMSAGGRIIYVGAGTSGRIAAMDAVEIPCTYGLAEDRILAVIAGSISDASIEIESDYEEDASSVPEMLLLNIQPEDVVIGISASGVAYFVQSALALANSRGALSVLIQNNMPKTKPSFCDFVIPLNSGNEVVAGSTRMKAGTATKKVLNFISSTIMIKMGKVIGPYMTDVACINNKLVERAQNILKTLYNINEVEALEKLKLAKMSLKQVIQDIEKNQK